MGAGPAVHKIMKDFEGKVKLVVKHYPYQYRDFSHIAAEAAMAANDQGKFWEMHSLMLKKSPQLEKKSLIKYAQDLGLDVKKFTDSIETKKYSGIIERDKKLAKSMDLYNTPTFFINGRMVVGNRSYEYLRRIVEEELKNAKK